FHIDVEKWDSDLAEVDKKQTQYAFITFDDNQSPRILPARCKDGEWLIIKDDQGKRNQRLAEYVQKRNAQKLSMATWSTDYSISDFWERIEEFDKDLKRRFDQALAKDVKPVETKIRGDFNPTRDQNAYPFYCPRQEALTCGYRSLDMLIGNRKHAIN